MTIANEEVIQLIEDYFAKSAAFDADGMLECWHSGGMMYLVGNQNQFRVVPIEEQAAHVREVKEISPDLAIEFVIEEVEQVVVHEDLIAAVHLRYRMILPEGYGKHRCFFNLAKIAGKWGIVNVVDRGFQVLEVDSFVSMD